MTRLEEKEIKALTDRMLLEMYTLVVQPGGIIGEAKKHNIKLLLQEIKRRMES